ncbi:MAG: response regulator [bacterium]
MIKSRLWFGFGAILALVLLLGVISSWQTGKIWSNTEYLYKHPFKVNIALREIQTNVMTMHRNVKMVVLSENQDELNAAVHDINVCEAEVYRLFDTIYLLYLGRRSSVDTAFHVFSDWKPMRDETIRLSQAGQRKEAVNRSRNIGDPEVMLIVQKLNVLRDFARNKAASFYQSAENGKNLLYLQLIVILIVILLISIAIVTFVMRGITGPLQGLVSSVEEYWQGHYHIRNPHVSKSELGILAASMNKLAETVEFEINVKNGVLEIADAMLANDEMPAFSKAVLGTLMRKTNSNLGAIYFLNEQTATFEPYFSIGFRSDNLKSFSADSNEGEFGAVLTGKTIVKQLVVPDDSLFLFSTVSGTLKPKEIITIPVIRRGMVIAVVSLAGLTAYSEESLEILRQSSKNMDMSVNAILAFERIREYAFTMDNQNEQLSLQSKELQAQTGELVEQNTELEIQKQQLDEANRLKSQFLSNMSHELRTPLNSVIALTGVLGKKLKTKIPDEEYSYLEIIGRNGRNLLALINDILDLSRIEAGKTEVNIRRFQVNQVVQHIVSSLQGQASEKNIVLENLIGTDIPMISSDSSMCHHILQNLIANAVKFTDAGSVRISAEQIGSEVCVSVKDTGIGIPASQLPHIFDEFRQVDGSTSRQYGGTGLGLAIVKKYAELLNIKVDVVSELGSGSTFSLFFPAGQTTVGTAGDVEPGTTLESSVKHHFAIPRKSNPAGLTILIVEDSEPAIIQLLWILKDQPYQIEIARNGIEALEAVKLKIPDGIILDLMMPGMDGFEVLEAIRSTRETACIPVLILTAQFLSTKELQRLTENHIHQFVQKGDINKDELIAIVRKMMFPVSDENSAEPQFIASRKKIKGPANILIIDDNTDNGITLRVLLSDKHRVVVENDGAKGLATAKVMKPDLILLDISLPGMDGFQVFSEFRKDTQMRDVPVIAVSARAMKGDREHILAHGFDDYISKPVEQDVFDETIGNWIS